MRCKDNEIYAGFFVRFFAYLIDSVIVFLMTSTISLTGGIIALSNSDSLLNKYSLFDIKWLTVITYICKLFYYVAMTYCDGSTLGKKLMRIKVVSSKDIREKLSFVDVLYRESIGKFLSGILCIGYLMIAATEQKTGIHDRLSDTRVIYYSRFLVRKTVYKTVVDANSSASDNKQSGIKISLEKESNNETNEKVFKLPKQVSSESFESELTQNGKNTLEKNSSSEKEEKNVDQNEY